VRRLRIETAAGSRAGSQSASGRGAQAEFSRTVLDQDFPTSSPFGNTGKGVADPVATILMLLDGLADQQSDERCGRLGPRGDRFRPRLRAEGGERSRVRGRSGVR
jgi:hypothetical protein